ncbi:aminotransferase class V-fold PLP-dependent enzyme [Sorangium sp. So ce321]|uniref:aminotransferase class V-fold PLP-dependent enzyme n=1 Tax=Sorangium sp. So ce321 TaxID=3133300 RepID=UPI003F5E5340
MRAIIIGGGPIACLTALELRRRSFDVHIYEKYGDPRRSRADGGPSFNLTLTLRGLRCLSAGLRETLYAHGVPMHQRVVHHEDSSLSYQPYGMRPEHHLLSIPRAVLHRTLLNEAERAGARISFNHECVRIDAHDARASLMAQDALIQDEGDILVGCDGTNSFVRYELSRSGARVDTSQEHIAHGYVELHMPPTARGEHALLQRRRDPCVPESLNDGLHVWPRGDLVLIAQPNVDKTYTTTLFMPQFSDSPELPAFQHLRTHEDVRAFFERHFSDAVELLPRTTEDFFRRPPASLRTIKCSSFHHGRAVLLGDSAHTMVPFYGQGINCSFEDVHTFFEIFDRNLRDDRERAVANTLPAFTAARKSPCDAVAGLSLANLRELSTHTGEKKFHVRSRLERELYRRYPGEFTPLYCMVAFSRLPYDEVIVKHRDQQSILDALVQRFDVETEADKIIESYAARSRAPSASTGPARAASCGLELSAEQMRELVDTTTSYILKYHRDVSSGELPASYAHDSLDADAYAQGKRVAAELREHQVPEDGTDLHALLGEIFDKAMPSGTIHSHPGFMAHIPSGGLFQAAVGDFIARATNRFAGVWIAAPGLIQLEANVIKWFCAMLGYGERAFGYLTTGGSIANLMGLVCAIRRSRDAGSSYPTIYTSAQGHFSVTKAAGTLGLQRSQVRIISVRHDYSMDTSELEERLEQDRAMGLTPACVVATAGTTNTGAIDDLATISELCRRQGVWLHVDACFGGFFGITKRGKEALKSIEEADSISVDAHKSLFLPHGLAALLVKEQAHLRRTFEIDGAAYLPGFTRDPELIDFCNYGPELSREIRGLAAWLPIKLHGIRAFERCLDEKIDLAERLAAELGHIDRIEVIRRHQVLLPVVNFKMRARASAEEDRINERLCQLICSYGNTYLTTTKLPDHGTVIRACILHHMTGAATIDRLVEDIKMAVAATNARADAPGASFELAGAARSSRMRADARHGASSSDQEST